MLCPVCDVHLLLSIREGVEIDCCPQCGGIWLDRGELFNLFYKMSNQTDLEQSHEQKVEKKTDNSTV